jgi:hypothetical protein
LLLHDRELLEEGILGEIELLLHFAEAFRPQPFVYRREI